MGQRIAGTLREMAGQQPPATQTPGAPGAQHAADEADEALPEGLDLRRLYNENRKMQRLLGKQQKEFSDFRTTVEPMTGAAKTLKSMQALLAGEAVGVGTPAEGAPEEDVYDMARRAHESIIAADPDAPGMPLTLKIAEVASKALKTIKEQQAIIEKLQGTAAKIESPMYVAEQGVYVGLETDLREQVAALYGDEATGDTHYPDFERVAIQRIGELKKDRVKWRMFVTSPAARSKFVKDVIQSKIPRAYAPRGAQGIDEYTPEQRAADQRRVETMAPGQERAALARKIRQSLLPELLGVNI